MDHSGKWTTSSVKNGEFLWFLAKTEEPVVHSGEWTTSSLKIGAFPWIPAKTAEPVDHWLPPKGRFPLVLIANYKSMPSSLVQQQGKGFSVTFFRQGNKKMTKTLANATKPILSRIRTC